MNSDDPYIYIMLYQYGVYLWNFGVSDRLCLAAGSIRSSRNSIGPRVRLVFEIYGKG